MITIRPIRFPATCFYRSHHRSSSPTNKPSGQESAKRREDLRKVVASATLVMLWGTAQAGNADSADSSDTRIPQGTAASYLEANHYDASREHNSTRKAGNTSVIRQQGSRNTALIDQMLHGPGLGNVAGVDQLGNDNEAAIIQRGAGNVGLLVQHGNILTYRMYQQGEQHSAVVQQSGYDASLSLSQSGSGLRTLKVRQWAPSGAGTRVTVDTR